jgi:hypothetical protein
MTKVVLALLLCCNVAAAQATKGAIGLPHRPAASAARPNTNTSTNPRVRSILDFGGLQSPRDSTLALQKAIASLDDGTGFPGVVTIPSGYWDISSPVFLNVDNVELRGEGPSTRIRAKQGFPPIIVSLSSNEKWRKDCPLAGMPTTFNPDHRVDLFGKVDGTAAPAPGQRFGLRSRSPSSPAPRNLADHYLSFWGGPPCFGSYDYWTETRKWHIAIFLENPQGPLGFGPICGMGAKGDFGGPAPWILQAGDGLFQDPKLYFFFRTAGDNSIRFVSFGSTTVTGPVKIDLYGDFTRNGPDGLCPIFAAINGVCVPVTRGWGTRLSSASKPSTATWQTTNLPEGDYTVKATWNGHPNHATNAPYEIWDNTNVVQTAVADQKQPPAGGSASDSFQTLAIAHIKSGTLKVSLSNSANGDVVADAIRITSPQLAAPIIIDDGTPNYSETGTGWTGWPSGYNKALRYIAAARGPTEPSFTATDKLRFSPNETTTFHVFAQAYSIAYPLFGINLLNLYGMRICGDLIYRDGVVGQPLQRIDGKPVNDFVRYFDEVTDAEKSICWLPLTDQPHMPERTSDRLVLVRHGAKGHGFASFAWFSYNENQYGLLMNNQGNRLSNMCIESQHGPAAVAFGTAFSFTSQDVDYLGGWWGAASLNLGGYDYRFNGGSMQGADAGFFGMQMLVKELNGLRRVDVGRTYLRLVGCEVDCSQIIIGNLNTPGGITTEAVVKCHNAAYAADYRIRKIETDSENTSGPSVALVLCDRHGGYATFLMVEDVKTGNMGKGAPVVALVGGNKTPQEAGPGFCILSRVKASDGLLLTSDGPGWNAIIRDSVYGKGVTPVIGSPQTKLENCIMLGP